MASVRILIVEDESLVAESVTDMLERLGYSVPAVASSAEDAMARVEETRPDIVLMDIGLPGKMDGVEAANEIRQRFDIPVVYVTAYADEETLQRAKITQPFGYVLKPFQLRELHSAVEIALYRHATDKKLKASEARYRAVSELTSDYAYSLRVKPDGSLEPEWETEAFKRILGWSMQEIVAQGGLETLLHPDDLPIARQHLQTHLAGLPDVREYRVISRSGQVRWIRDYGQPVLDQDEGRVVRLYGAAQDITEQVEAEEALRHKLEEQAALYESSQVFLDQLDVHATLRNVCRLAVVRFGMPKACIELAIEDSSEALAAADCVCKDDVGAPQRPADVKPVYRSSTALPLCYGDQVLGALRLYSEEANHFTQDRLQVLQAFANLAAVALQKARLHEETQRHAAELEQRVAERTSELRRANAQLQREVSERRRAEELLRKSEERFRTVADFTHDWEYWVDPDGNFLYISPSCRRITGHTIYEFQDNPRLLESIAHPDDRRVITEHIRNELERREALSMEFRIITKSGDERWIDHVCQPVHSADGRWLGQRASNRDITDRKRVEGTLRQYERIVSATPDLMALIDRNFRYQAVNDAYMKAYGRSRDQIIGHPVHELMGEELFDSLLHSRFNRCLEGIASSYEAWLEFPRRGRRFMSVTYYPYFDTSGAVAGIMLSFRDVTDLKRAEEGLRRSEAKYRAMFAASPDYIYITDTEAKFLDANPAFLRWAGLSPEELQQRYFRHFFAGDHVDKLQAYIEKIKAGEVIHKLGMRVKNTRGEIAECEINGVPLEENGGITAILNMARDVTEQVRADSTLRESEEKYRALFEASTDAILLETVDGRVLDCNARACDMYGYSHEELTRLSVVDLVPEGIAEELPGLIAEGLAAGSVIVRAAGKRKDGSLFPTEVGTRLISLRGRQLVVAYVRDLTGQVPAQEVPRRLTILPQP